MSDTYFEILQRSCSSGNYIPSGRQLPRTPPLTNVTRQLDFTNLEEPEQNMEDGVRDKDEGNQKSQTDTELPESHDPHSMLKGMKGYQLTAADLEFLKKMKEEQLVKKMQVKLEEVQKLLKMEMVALEMACASKVKAEAELKRFPSCIEVTEWAKVVLRMACPQADLTDADAKSLLSMMKMRDIQDAMDKKTVEFYQIEKMVANKRKEEAEERGQMERQIANKQLRIQGLMRQLSDLKAELAQREEACKSLEMQVNITEAPEIKEDLDAIKSQMKLPRKRQKKAVKSTEMLQDATNTSKSTRSRNRDTLKTSAEEPTRSGAPGEQQKKKVKASRGENEEAEGQDLNSRESVQPVGGRRKPAGTAQTTVSQQKSHSKVKTGEPEVPSRGRRAAATTADNAGEEAQNEGLRRSKRIASKK
ncbi:paramyosin-like isoform X2 [Simochromis diagramma]|uniref:paramyosin-like isoform X2 n=1 Tax=Simochromis diagramma TaxID=43689 RepID=UPI001A7EE843|nr:paramyosin-like isoform X2 [Simochromis diagramma]